MKTDKCILICALFNIATVVEDEKCGRKWDNFMIVFKVMFLPISHSSFTELCSEKV
jgi:hypothetical protein